MLTKPVLKTAKIKDSTGRTFTITELDGIRKLIRSRIVGNDLGNIPFGQIITVLLMINEIDDEVISLSQNIFELGDLYDIVNDSGITALFNAVYNSPVQTVHFQPVNFQSVH